MWDTNAGKVGIHCYLYMWSLLFTHSGQTVIEWAKMDVNEKQAHCSKN